MSNIPKKIYINCDNEGNPLGGDAAAVTGWWSQTREYTDLSQVWHKADPAAPPERQADILGIDSSGKAVLCGRNTDLGLAVRFLKLRWWAYADELMPYNVKAYKPKESHFKTINKII